MSYLLDRKLKKQKIWKIILIIVLLLLAFYFRSNLTRGFSSATHFIFKPFLSGGRAVGQFFQKESAILHYRKTLQADNDQLRAYLSEQENRIANYQSLLDENNQLKESLGRKPTEMKTILAGILAKPNRSLYDTLLIDAGTNEGVLATQRVFALGNIPIGYIGEAYSNSAKVILYSNPGEQTEVVISGQNAFMQVTGRGGGNFEMILPRDFTPAEGAEINLPGTSYLLAKLVTIISDPRDSFQKALLASPVNIQNLKFVTIEQ